MKHTLSCHLSNVVFSTSNDVSSQGFAYKVKVSVENSELKSAFKIEEEKYELEITKTDTKIVSKTYVGFVRGL